MRICYFLRRFPVRSQTFVVEEIKGLNNNAHELSVFSFLTSKFGNSDPYFRKIEEQFSIINIPSLVLVFYANLHWIIRKPKSYFEGMHEIAKVYCRDPVNFMKAAYFYLLGCAFAMSRCVKDAELIVCHWVDQVLAGAIAAKFLLGKPFIVRAHTPMDFSQSNQAVKLLIHSSILLPCNKATEIAAIDRLGKTCIPIQRIPQVINIKKIPYRRKRASGWPRILSIGRLVEKKGIAYLLDALSLLNNSGIEFECKIIGDGELRDELESLASELGLGERISFIGFVTHDQIPAFLYDANVFVSPNIESNNYSDGLPTVILEAMASGLPVIASDAASNSEVISNNNTGLLVRERSCEELANALHKLFTDRKLMKTIALNARELVLEEYSGEIVIRKLSEIFSNYAEGQIG